MILTRSPQKSKTSHAADRIVNSPRRRYLRLPLTARPAMPDNALGLFSPVELLMLALAKRWPLTPSDIAFIVAPSRHRRCAVLAGRRGGAA